MKKYILPIAIAAVILIVAIVAALWFFGNKPLDPIGTWHGTYTYNGNEFESTFILKEDGTYTKETYKNGSFSSSEKGTYEVIDGKSVLLRKDGNKTTGMEFTYEGGKLVNNDHKFSKQE